MDVIVARDGDCVDAGDLAHDGEEIVVEAAAAEVIGEDHAVARQQIFAEHRLLAGRKCERLRPGHEDQRRSRAFGERIELAGVDVFGLLGDLALGPAGARGKNAAAISR